MTHHDMPSNYDRALLTAAAIVVLPIATSAVLLVLYVVIDHPVWDGLTLSGAVIGVMAAATAAIMQALRRNRRAVAELAREVAALSEQVKQLRVNSAVAELSSMGEGRDADVLSIAGRANGRRIIR